MAEMYTDAALSKINSELDKLAVRQNNLHNAVQTINELRRTKDRLLVATVTADVAAVKKLASAGGVDLSTWEGND